MELKDVRSAIRHYPNIETVNGRELSVTFESTGQKYHFTGLYNIFKFYYEQNEKWKTIDNIENIFNDSKNFFEYATTNLEDFINLRIINEKASEFDFDSFFQTLESRYLSPNKYVFPFDSPEVGFLQNIAVKNKDLVIPAYNYIIDSNLNSNSKLKTFGELKYY